MKKYFVSADIHGFFNEWQNALAAAGFDRNNPDHIIINCGDLMDRGPQPAECLDFVNDMYEAGRAILIRGNHEDLFDDILSSNEFNMYDYHNGTVLTYVKLCEVGKVTLQGSNEIIDTVKNYNPYKLYRSHLVNFYQLGKYIFVHGWIPCYETSLGKYEFNPDWDIGNWSEARWINGMYAWNCGVRLPNKTIVCGHWHTSWGHYYIEDSSEEWPVGEGPEAIAAIDFSPFIQEGIIALDACTALSGKVNIYVINEDEIE